jgi:rhodanese-related sulfurtransferase
MHPVQTNVIPALAPPEAARDELRARLRDASLKLVNVLPREAFDEAHIPGSLSLPVAQLPQQARAVLPDLAQEIIVYCGSFT